MRSGLVVAAVVLTLSLAGCRNKTSMLIGTWKAKQVAPLKSNNFADVAQSSMTSLGTQGMTIEFNKEGSFKISQMMGSGTGTYLWKDDVLEMKLNTFSPFGTIKMKFGESGKTLETVTEFPSDPKVVFEKQ